ncbi:MAG: ABC transporter permease [Limnobacter sp.]|nr:ABC transporter permease [Limnobacter sp.]
MSLRHLLKLVFYSALSRSTSLSLLLVCVATSASLLLSLDLIRQSAKQSFAQSVSGTDLIVGGPGSPMGLMLYSVFRLGEPARELPYSAVEFIQKDKRVAWALPMSLGDSYRGFPVLGTEASYFQHFKYGARQPLTFAQGKPFENYAVGEPVEKLYGAVLGSEVAKRLKHALGDELELSHGLSLIGTSHKDKPFKVVGILDATGTPVDRTVHIGLPALEAIHLDWQAGAPLPGMKIPAELVGKFDLSPKSVTAVLVGLNNRAAVFSVKRAVEGIPDTPVTAVLPGVALSQLWDMLGNVEQLLWLISALVGLVSILGLVGVMLMSLSQRRGELAVLRSVGAGRWTITGALVLESGLVMLGGVLLAYALTGLGLLLLGPWVQSEFGLSLLPLHALGQGHIAVAVYGLMGTLLGLIPAWGAYRQQVQSGLTPRA